MRNRHGFTLIELMIVVAIIGILAAIAVPNFMTFLSKSRRTESKSNLEAIYKAQLSYFGEYDRYSNDFNVIRWRPEGVSFYTYSMGAGTLGLPLAQNPQPASITPFANDNSYAAYAWGNIDNDNTVDIWHIDESKVLTADADDLSS